MNNNQLIDILIQRFINEGIGINKHELPDEFCSIDFIYLDNTYSIVIDKTNQDNLIFHNGTSSYIPKKHSNRKEFTLSELLTIDLNYFLNYVYENYTN